jgi:hypothetical protein
VPPSAYEKALSTLLAGRRRLIVAASDRRLAGERAALATAKAPQRDAFARVAGAASERFEAIRDRDRPTFSVPLWSEHVRALEREFLPSPPFAFIRHPRILATMFVILGGSLLRAQLAELRTTFSDDQLRTLLAEELVGDPVLMDRSFGTSHQNVHHLYHLKRFVEATGAEPARLGTVVEWGAGYGNQARIFRALHGGTPTQILIDLPLFSLLQWLYLTTVLGPDSVALLDSPERAIEPGRINVVPVGLADAVPRTADLFVSTWALSETARPAQDYVIEEAEWFGARHLLLAHQTADDTFPEAERIGRIAEAAGGRIEPLRVMRGSSYTFR